MPEYGSDGCFLHQYSTLAHTVLSVKQFLTNKNITVMEHPPYSPDLAPCDFSIFPTVKSCLKGTHFTSVNRVQAKMKNLRRYFRKLRFRTVASSGSTECKSL
ncbi:uncharacterized protein TNCV_3375441 [Trichonephila clavipes]|nr:uncharacterized protein TNCV_3375441 [Trichonephila clavipes]